MKHKKHLKRWIESDSLRCFFIGREQKLRKYDIKIGVFDILEKSAKKDGIIAMIIISQTIFDAKKTFFVAPSKNIGKNGRIFC